MSNVPEEDGNPPRADPRERLLPWATSSLPGQPRDAQLVGAGRGSGPVYAKVAVGVLDHVAGTSATARIWRACGRCGVGRRPDASSGGAALLRGGRIIARLSDSVANRPRPMGPSLCGQGAARVVTQRKIFRPCRCAAAPAAMSHLEGLCVHRRATAGKLAALPSVGCTTANGSG